jgi:hypothetical protein
LKFLDSINSSDCIKADKFKDSLQAMVSASSCTDTSTKPKSTSSRYDMSTNGRKLDRICAGTFGAPVREWVPGYPLQYNLLKIEDNQLTVYTRRREELNGAWKPDARWGQGAGKTPLDYYAIKL